MAATLTKIGIGSAANDGTGDDLRTAMGQINDNYDEFYTDGSIKCVVVSAASVPPTTQADTLTRFSLSSVPGAGWIGLFVNSGPKAAYLYMSDGTDIFYQTAFMTRTST